MAITIRPDLAERGGAEMIPPSGAASSTREARRGLTSGPEQPKERRIGQRLVPARPVTADQKQYRDIVSCGRSCIT